MRVRPNVVSLPMVRRSQLQAARRARRLIRFSRRFEDYTVRGYVLDVGPQFFLLALVSDRIWFDGFECFRMSDVPDLRADPYARFAEAALKRRGERFPRRPRVRLCTAEELLLSATRVFPLVTIHRERVDPTVCHIGRVLGVDNGRVSLLEIKPDARWRKEPTAYRVNEITRVNFGGDYEDALAGVSGARPQANPRLQRTALARRR
jgi:hypothetical protein